MNVLVAGAGGALGGHLVKRLVEDGHVVRAADIKPFGEWWQLDPNAENHVYDLRIREDCYDAVQGMDQVYNLAADMGGIGWITDNRANAMLSVLINTHLLLSAQELSVWRYWYASSACVYAADKQDTPESGYRLLREPDAYPAMAEAGYGEEKLFSERMCEYVGADYGIKTRIARMHNVYGPYSTWTGGREKAPAALCRKVAEAKVKGQDFIEVWGDGSVTRSFLYVDDWVEGAIRIMNSDYPLPVNLGSEEVVTVDELVSIVMKVAGVDLERRYDTSKPQGVKGRGSENTLIREITGWEPSISLRQGIELLYPWVEQQVKETLTPPYEPDYGVITYLEAKRDR